MPKTLFGCTPKGVFLAQGGNDMRERMEEFTEQSSTGAKAEPWNGKGDSKKRNTGKKSAAGKIAIWRKIAFLCVDLAACVGMAGVITMWRRTW